MNKTKKEEENIEVLRPDDPIFRRPGHNRRNKDARVSSPVWGIMTEPIVGNIKGGWTEYIPSSHVKFLEQTGAKVIPISYTLSKEDLTRLLD
jgi:hypothetical protein